MRRLLGWRVPVTVGRLHVVVPVVVSLLLCCCLGTCGLGVVGNGLQRAGLLPTLTATVTATRTPARTDTATAGLTVRPSETPTAAAPTVTPTAAATRPATSTATATEVPTQKPAPTVQPSRTPMPTATPGLSAAEALYVTAVQPLVQGYGEALTGLSAQSAAAGQNAALLLNADWRLKTAIYLASIQMQGQALRKISPPGRFVAMHGELLAAAGHLDAMVTLYAEGVDEVNGAKLEAAAARMNQGNAAIQRATTEMQKAMR